MIGYNFRMGEIEAAIASVQLDKLAERVADRQRVAAELNKGLGGLKGLNTPKAAEGATHVYYVYGMTLDLETLGVSRAKIVEALKAEGVPAVMPGYQNIHRLPIFTEQVAYGTSGFPWSLRDDRILCLWHRHLSGRRGTARCELPRAQHLRPPIAERRRRADRRRLPESLGQHGRAQGLIVTGFLELAGEKVRLKPFGSGDITDAYIGWLNDPEVTRYSNQRFRHHTRESCKEYLASFAGTRNLFVSVRISPDNTAIGTMTAYRDLNHGTCDVGIMIGERDCWGGGYGQEAWNLLTAWLLEVAGVRKLTAGCLAANGGMVKLMERSGMVPDGVRKAQELVDGEPVDIVHYAKFADR